MIRSLYFLNGGQVEFDIAPETYASALQKEAGLLWVDFQGEPNETSEPILINTFQFHPLAVDDALRETHIPKVDDWETFIYVALHAVTFDQKTQQLDTVELDVFLGKNYIVTHHDIPIPALDRIWSNFHRDERYQKMGSDHVLYRITDELVVDYMHTIEAIDDELEQIEDRMFLNPNQAALAHTFAVKRSLLRLRRILSPLREVMNKLGRDDYEVIDRKDQVYFRDVYDHLVRLHDITESLRDLVAGAQDTYLSVINNRMNDVMKTLTVITTLFMPISFISGFFGMNFFQPAVDLVEWTAYLPFLFTLVIMIITPLAMLMWIKRKGWM